MAKLITLLEQHLERQPPTVVTPATAWWEAVFALVKLWGGLGVHLLVNVCCSCVHSGVKNWLIFPSVYVKLPTLHIYARSPVWNMSGHTDHIK